MDKIGLSGIKVGVLMGGVSGEREISLSSGRETVMALRRQGVSVEAIDVFTSCKDTVKDLIKNSNIDIAFIALHGEFGEDGAIQMILDDLDMSYTGSGPRASALAMDKIASKKIFIRDNIPTPAFIVLEKNSTTENLEFPKVIKPYCSGSSLGVSIVYEQKQLQSSLDKAFSVSDKVMVEDYIAGRELTVGIFAGEPLSVVEVIPKRGYYDFNTKYSDGLAIFQAPASLEGDIYRTVMDTALRAHRSLGCRHFSRVDIRLNSWSSPFILEVNSIPGLTCHSLLPLSAGACGISFDQLIITMVKLALKDAKKETQTA